MRRRKGAHNIDVDLVESGVRGLESRERCYCVAVDLGSLAWETRSRPCGDVLSHSWPDKSSRNQLVCCLFPKMRQGV